MHSKPFYVSLKALAHAVLLMMAVAIVYAFVMSIRYWSGIGV